MELINQILPTEMLHALGWAVVHSLWQAFAVALLLAAYLLAWQKTDARKRYIAGNVALGTTLLLAAGTFVFYLERSKSQSLRNIYAADGTVMGQFFVEGQEGGSFFNDYFNENMPLIVTVWALGLVFFMLKMLGGLLYIQRLKTRMTAPLPKLWLEKIGLLSNELHIARPVRLLESALAQAPMVVGWLKPIILLPMGAVNNLSPAQVEAILAHELAHIARHDYLLNLLQSCIEILFYFNPAVWWISAHVRTERENCCDDIAVGLCGNSLAYAKALVSLQEMQLAAPAFAMPFSKNKNQLLLRIQRILQPSQNKSNLMEKLSATLLLTVAVVLLSVQANTPFGNLITKVVTEGLPSYDVYAPAEEDDYIAAADTIPDGTRDAHFHISSDEEQMEVKVEDDEIIFLKIDGEVIPAERYEEYEEMVREIMENVPTPPEVPEFPEMPEMPAMPAMPCFPEFPAMPASPSFDGFPAPPAPPAPPSRSRKIITQKDGNGTTFIIENEDGSEPVEIVVKDGKKGTIIVNGQEITGLKKGDKTIIMQDMPANSFSYLYGDAFSGQNDYSDFPAQADFRLLGHADLLESYPSMATELEALRARDFPANLAREWEFAAEGKLNSEEWQAAIEEQQANFNAEIAKMQERQQQLMGERQEEIARAMENVQKAQEEVLRKMEKARKEAKRRNGSM